MCAVGLSPGMPLANAPGNGVLGTLASRPHGGKAPGARAGRRSLSGRLPPAGSALRAPAEAVSPRVVPGSVPADCRDDPPHRAGSPGEGRVPALIPAAGYDTFGSTSFLRRDIDPSHAS